MRGASLCHLDARTRKQGRENHSLAGFFGRALIET